MPIDFEPSCPPKSSGWIGASHRLCTPPRTLECPPFWGLVGAGSWLAHEAGDISLSRAKRSSRWAIEGTSSAPMQTANTSSPPPRYHVCRPINSTAGPRIRRLIGETLWQMLVIRVSIARQTVLYGSDSRPRRRARCRASQPASRAECRS
jgi:hypothetical protein